jgi:large subunit ribosomal protein L13e
LRYNIKIREGRGFTFEELKKAGFHVKKAQKLGIAVDHRRRNTNEESLELNVQRLNEYKAKLIVFPHKTCGKKGEKKMAVDVLPPWHHQFLLGW